jgi:hypothetical protein
MNKADKLINGVADYLMRDEDVESVEVVITRRVTERVVRSRPKADQPAEEPVLSPPVEPDEPEPAEEPVPQSEAKDEGRERSHCLPDKDTLTKGRKFSDATVARVKMLLVRGVRISEIARMTGVSYSQVSNIKGDRSRRAVPAAPDPRVS